MCHMSSQHLGFYLIVVHLQILAAERARSAPPDDITLVIATLPPGLREEVLITCDDDTLARLPRDVRAEAEQLRQRQARRV